MKFTYEKGLMRKEVSFHFSAGVEYKGKRGVSKGSFLILYPASFEKEFQI